MYSRSAVLCGCFRHSRRPSPCTADEPAPPSAIAVGMQALDARFFHPSSSMSWLAHTVPQQSISRLPIRCGETMDADVDAGNACVLHAVERHRTSTATPALDANGFRHQYPFHPLNYNCTCSVAGSTQQWCCMSDPCDSRACSGGGSRVLSTTE